MASDDRLKDPKFVKWASDVREFYDFTCQICFKRGSRGQSHHLYAWNAYPDERYNLENGVFLCIPCHEKFHHQFGFGNNTKEQFLQFQKFCKLIDKVTKNGKVGLEKNFSKQNDSE